MERKGFKHMKYKLNAPKIMPSVELCNHQRIKGMQPEKISEEEKELRANESILLSTVSWYWGEIKPTQICYIMQGCSDGTFMVNASKETDEVTHNLKYSLAVKRKSKVHIFQIQHRNGELSLDFSNPHQPRAVTLFALVSKILQVSRTYSCMGEIQTDRPPTIPVALKYPVSRISSLKAHCRRVIRLKYEKSDIEDLPIPEQLKTYLIAI